MAMNRNSPHFNLCQTSTSKIKIKLISFTINSILHLQQKTDSAQNHHQPSLTFEDTCMLIVFFKQMVIQQQQIAKSTKLYTPEKQHGLQFESLHYFLEKYLQLIIQQHRQQNQYEERKYQSDDNSSQSNNQSQRLIENLLYDTATLIVQFKYSLSVQFVRAFSKLCYEEQNQINQDLRFYPTTNENLLSLVQVAFENLRNSNIEFMIHLNSCLEIVTKEIHQLICGRNNHGQIDCQNLTRKNCVVRFWYKFLGYIARYSLYSEKVDKRESQQLLYDIILSGFKLILNRNDSKSNDKIQDYFSDERFPYQLFKLLLNITKDTDRRNFPERNFIHLALDFARLFNSKLSSGYLTHQQKKCLRIIIEFFSLLNSKHDEDTIEFIMQYLIHPYLRFEEDQYFELASVADIEAAKEFLVNDLNQITVIQEKHDIVVFKEKLTQDQRLSLINSIFKRADFDQNANIQSASQFIYGLIDNINSMIYLNMSFVVKKSNQDKSARFNQQSSILEHDPFKSFTQSQTGQIQKVFHIKYSFDETCYIPLSNQYLEFTANTLRASKKLIKQLMGSGLLSRGGRQFKNQHMKSEEEDEEDLKTAVKSLIYANLRQIFIYQKSFTPEFASGILFKYMMKFAQFPIFADSQILKTLTLIILDRYFYPNWLLITLSAYPVVPVSLSQTLIEKSVVYQQLRQGQRFSYKTFSSQQQLSYSINLSDYSQTFLSTLILGQFEITNLKVLIQLLLNCPQIFQQGNIGQIVQYLKNSVIKFDETIQAQWKLCKHMKNQNANQNQVKNMLQEVDQNRNSGFKKNNYSNDMKSHQQMQQEQKFNFESQQIKNEECQDDEDNICGNVDLSRLEIKMYLAFESVALVTHLILRQLDNQQFQNESQIQENLYQLQKFTQKLFAIGSSHFNVYRSCFFRGNSNKNSIQKPMCNIQRLNMIYYVVQIRQLLNRDIHQLLSFMNQDSLNIFDKELSQFLLELALNSINDDKQSDLIIMKIISLFEDGMLDIGFQQTMLEFLQQYCNSLADASIVQNNKQFMLLFMSCHQALMHKPGYMSEGNASPQVMKFFWDKFTSQLIIPAISANVFDLSKQNQLKLLMIAISLSVVFDSNNHQNLADRGIYETLLSLTRIYLRNLQQQSELKHLNSQDLDIHRFDFFERSIFQRIIQFAIIQTLGLLTQENEIVNIVKNFIEFSTLMTDVQAKIIERLSGAKNLHKLNVIDEFFNDLSFLKSNYHQTYNSFHNLKFTQLTKVNLACSYINDLCFVYNYDQNQLKMNLEKYNLNKSCIEMSEQWRYIEQCQIETYFLRSLVQINENLREKCKNPNGQECGVLRPSNVDAQQNSIFYRLKPESQIKLLKQILQANLAPDEFQYVEMLSKRFGIYIQ
eukprot:403346901